MNNLPKATHTYSCFFCFFVKSLSHTVLSVSKQVFLSVTQTAPSCVCQCYVKLLNSGTTSHEFTEMRLYVSLYCQAQSKRKRLRARGEKKKKEIKKERTKSIGWVPRLQENEQLNAGISKFDIQSSFRQARRLDRPETSTTTK